MRSCTAESSKPQAQPFLASLSSPRCTVRPVSGGALRVEISTTTPRATSRARVRAIVEGFAFALAARFAPLEDLERLAPLSLSVQLVHSGERLRVAFDVTASAEWGEGILRSAHDLAILFRELPPLPEGLSASSRVAISRRPLASATMN